MVNPRFDTIFFCIAVVGLLTPAAPALGQEAEPASVDVITPENPPPGDDTGGEEDMDDEAAAFLSGGDGTAGEAPVENEAAEPEDEAGVQEASPTEADSESQEEEDQGFHHRLQAGLGLIFGSGYNFAVAWGGEYCHQPGQEEREEVCHKRSPVFMDIQLAFGATEGLEVLLEYRLGLIEEAYLSSPSSDVSVSSPSRPMAFGLGVRYYVSPRSRFKFVIGAIIDLDFTKNLDIDVAIRPIFGLQFEIIRYLGLYAQGSVNLSFIRHFGMAFDLAGGIQARFP